MWKTFIVLSEKFTVLIENISFKCLFTFIKIASHMRKSSLSQIWKTESHLKAKKANRIVYRIKFHVTFYESSSSSISTKIPKHHSSLFVTLRFNSTALSSQTTFLGTMIQQQNWKKKKKGPQKVTATTATSTTASSAASRGCSNSSSGRRCRRASSERLKKKKMFFFSILFLLTSLW